MLSSIRNAWALFLGIGFIMLGNGLQASLLSLRATIEGFPTWTVGIVMTGYYMGFILGSLVAPVILGKVGHVRVFAALASMASTSVLIHVVFIEPTTWFFMRLVTGFAYAGLFVVAESWLNDMATNRTRGQLLSVYMVVMFLGLAGGQLLLNTADPISFELFLTASILISISLVPILLTVSPTPTFQNHALMRLTGVYKKSPLGVIGCAFAGFVSGTLFGIGAVYALARGLDIRQISIFMGLLIVGGITFQWPIGWCSDKFDRRKILTYTALIAAGAATLGGILEAHSIYGLYVLALGIGGLSLPMYSLCIAHTNDHLASEQIISASSVLVLVGGLGACAGPLAASVLLSIFGNDGFFWTLAIGHGVLGLFGLYRMTRREPVPIEKQRHYLNVPARPTVIASDAISQEKPYKAKI